jgi:hypothetical protein
MDSPVSDEIMTPVTRSDALQHAEITALRQMGDAVQVVVRSLETLTSKVDDVRERVIRLEEQKTARLVEIVEGKLEVAMARIDTLESQRDRERGAQSVWSWLSKNAAWMFAGMAAFVAGLAMKTGLFK